MSEELKSCPFCGTREGIITIPHAAGSRHWRVICGSRAGCLAKTAWYKSESEAIAAWNTRRPEPPRREAEEVVIEAARRLRLTSTEQGCSNSDINILRRAVDALDAITPAKGKE
jgi:hypothetical protein